MTNNDTLQKRITIQRQHLETVDHFKYLGAIICDEGSRREVLSRAAQTMAALARQENQNKTQNTTNAYPGHNKIPCDTWTLTAELQRRIQSLELRCFRKILGISLKDRITNEHVQNTITKRIGPYEDLLATVKLRKLKWYGHVTGSDGLTKVILQGTIKLIEGKRRKSRPKKRWTDIMEWTSISFPQTLAMANNQQE